MGSVPDPRRLSSRRRRAVRKGAISHDERPGIDVTRVRVDQRPVPARGAWLRFSCSASCHWSEQPIQAVAAHGTHGLRILGERSGRGRRSQSAQVSADLHRA